VKHLSWRSCLTYGTENGVHSKEFANLYDDEYYSKLPKTDIALNDKFYNVEGEINNCTSFEKLRFLQGKLLRYDDIVQNNFFANSGSDSIYVNTILSKNNLYIFKILKEKALDTYDFVFTSSYRTIQPIGLFSSILDLLIPNHHFAPANKVAIPIRKKFLHMHMIELIEKYDYLGYRELYNSLPLNSIDRKKLLFAIWICTVEKENFNYLAEITPLPSKIIDCEWFLTVNGWMFYPVVVQPFIKGHVLKKMVDQDRFTLLPEHINDKKIILTSIKQFVDLKNIDYNADNFIFDGNNMFYIDTQPLEMITLLNNKINRGALVKLLHNHAS
jgi:hypothetical protein